VRARCSEVNSLASFVKVEAGWTGRSKAAANVTKPVYDPVYERSHRVGMYRCAPATYGVQLFDRYLNFADFTLCHMHFKLSG
jgi:hypothetical protein